MMEKTTVLTYQPYHFEIVEHKYKKQPKDHNHHKVKYTSHNNKTTKPLNHIKYSIER